jgi:hypothetical protein
MEVLQGNFLCNYLKHLKMSLIFFYEIENKRVEEVLPGGLVPVWGE